MPRSVLETARRRRCLLCDAFIESGELCHNCRSDAEELLRELGSIAKYETLPVADLSVDHRYQRRDISEATLRKIRTQFNKHLLGTLTVSRRANGEQTLLDGQHRWLALRDMNFRAAPCEVFEGLSYEEEALIFGLRNRDRTTPSRAALFNSFAESGNEAAVRVRDICRSFGYKVASSHGKAQPDTIRSVAVIEQLYASGGLLAPVLTVIEKAWPHSLVATQGEMLMGLGTFLKAHGEVSAEQLAERLRGTRPEDVMARAKAMQSVGTVRALWVHIYRALVDSYNYRLSSHRITARDIRTKSWGSFAA